MTNFRGNIIVIGSLGVLNSLLIYFIKYSSNSLELSDFNILKIGNLINLALTLIFISGLIFIYFTEKDIKIIHLRFLTIISFSYLVPLVFLIIFNYTNLEFIDDYFLGYPFRKIFPVIFLVTNQILFLFSMFFIWFLFLGYRLSAYLNAIFSVTLLIIVLISASMLYSFSEEFDNIGNKKYDYGIVLGAAVWSNNKPSPIFSKRIDKVAELYSQGKIKKIHVTGGNAPGEVSEALAASEHLIVNHNISTNNILLEEVTSTTNEQIRYIKNNFARKQPSSKFLFISDAFHLTRVSEMADFYELNADVIPSKYELNFKKSLYYRFRDSIGLILFWFFAV